MKSLLKGVMAALVAFAMWSPARADCQCDPENMLVMDLEDGQVIITMRPDLAPRHVARIKELVRAGFYDGSPFHRVIEGFMAQGGSDPGQPGGQGGSGKLIAAEFSGASHKRGIVSMARLGNDVNRADSQFFIVLADSSYLDGKYSIWGEVTSGMEYVDRIKRGDPNDNGAVNNPDVILRMRVVADVLAVSG